jgi:hypothetical protein
MALVSSRARLGAATAAAAAISRPSVVAPLAAIRRSSPDALTPPPAAPVHRLAAAAALAAAALVLAPPPAPIPLAPPALAASPSLELEADLLPAAPSPSTTTTTVPRGYRNTVEGLIASVRDALDADDRGAQERDVRRRADPARERVREFVGKWRDSPLVSGTVYHEEVKAAIAELGAFYSKAGPRAAVTREVRASVLSHLETAEKALPPAEKSILGF